MRFQNDNLLIPAETILAYIESFPAALNGRIYLPVSRHISGFHRNYFSRN